MKNLKLNNTNIHNITCLASPYLSNKVDHKTNTNLADVCKIKQHTL